MYIKRNNQGEIVALSKVAAPDFTEQLPEDDAQVIAFLHSAKSAEQLALLEQALQTAGDRHVLVTFHHHPVSIGCRWMEPIGIRNPEALFAVLDRFPQVRAVLWGHVHQEIDQLRNNVRLIASPSTCIQFEPGSADFKVGEQAPGYRWLRLLPDGRLETGVERVTGFEFMVDYGSNGY